MIYYNSDQSVRIESEAVKTNATGPEVLAQRLKSTLPALSQQGR
jgi:hypothetical protein